MNGDQDFLRALVVEDEALIAMHLGGLLEEMGLDVVGPFAKAELALDRLQHMAPDVAVLDVNLGSGGTSFPVARALIGAGVPFVFLTGYGQAGVRDEFPGVPVLTKPVNEIELGLMITKLLQAAASDGASDGAPEGPADGKVMR